MKTIIIEIPCDPPTATSQQKGACRTGAGIRFFKKKNVQKAENTLFSLLQPHVPSEPIKGPLRLSVCWKMPWRKTEPKRNKLYGWRHCETRPDLSNLVKLMEDCMTTLRFWEDDNQIAELHLRKRWASDPGIYIEIQQLDQP